MKCPNCGKDLEQLSETEFFCKDDNLTIEVKDGKAKAQIGKGRLQSLEETVAILQKKQQDLEKDLYGDSAFPFLD